MEKQIYIVTKLFNVHDRIASLNLCNTIDKWIECGEISGYKNCFLPYRDSNEKIKGKPNQTLEIFKMDCQSIQNADLLVGYFDGPVYDSGIGFELGYAYVLGKPIILITTDYFEIIDDDNAPSPITSLTVSIADIIHIRDSIRPVVDYRDSLEEVIEQIQHQLKRKISQIECVQRNTIFQKSNSAKFDVFIDINFTKTESTNLILNNLLSSLHRKNKSYYIPTNMDYSDASILIDKINLCKSVLILGDQFDFQVDSSIVQGMAFALEKRIILYSSWSLRLHQSDDFVLFKNPMIEHSPTKIIRTLADTELI